MVVRDSWVCIRSVSQVLNGGEGTVGCIGSVSHMLNSDEGTVGRVSVSESGVKWW